MFSVTLYDFAVLPFYLVVILYFARKEVAKRNSPEYKYYIPGLLAKILGGIAVSLIYEYYYGGGDTINYFHSAVATLNVATENFDGFLQILGGKLDWETWSFYSNSTGYPLYFSDENAFAVVRFSTLFVFLGGKLFLPSTALVAWFSYTGLWRLYLSFSDQFPKQKNVLAYTVLFIPSVIFWGSGILKDSFCLTAASWMIYSIYRLFKTNVFSLKYYVLFGVFSAMTIAMKPYIFLSVTTGIFVWIAFEWINRVKSTFMKMVAFPFFFLVVIGTGVYLTSTMGEFIGGHYRNLDAMLERAVVVQSDLTREYYGGNSFNIGSFDASVSGILGKMPVAITAGLYRPFIWEANNILMLFSGLENFVLLILTVYTFFRVGFVFFLTRIVDRPFLVVFSFTFSLIFAFAVGLTTANFGALVRYKIPLIPFFTSGLVVVLGLHKERREKREKELLKAF